jgi:hypothetical protein
MSTTEIRTSVGTTWRVDTAQLSKAQQAQIQGATTNGIVDEATFEIVRDQNPGAFTPGAVSFHMPPPTGPYEEPDLPKIVDSVGAMLLNASLLAVEANRGSMRAQGDAFAMQDQLFRENIASQRDTSLSANRSKYRGERAGAILGLTAATAQGAMTAKGAQTVGKMGKESLRMSGKQGELGTIKARSEQQIKTFQKSEEAMIVKRNEAIARHEVAVRKQQDEVPQARLEERTHREHARISNERADASREEARVHTEQADAKRAEARGKRAEAFSEPDERIRNRLNGEARVADSEAAYSENAARNASTRADAYCRQADESTLKADAAATKAVELHTDVKNASREAHDFDMKSKTFTNKVANERTKLKDDLEARQAEIHGHQQTVQGQTQEAQVWNAGGQTVSGLFTNAGQTTSSGWNLDASNYETQKDYMAGIGQSESSKRDAAQSGYQSAKDAVAAILGAQKEMVDAETSASKGIGGRMA